MDESISTLRFASTAKNIKNKAKINEDSKDALLRKFQEQIAELKKQLEAEAEDGGDDEDAAGQGDESAAVHQSTMNPETMEKLKTLEHKIMIGGENLLEKAELQERLLAESEAELKAIRFVAILFACKRRQY